LPNMSPLPNKGAACPKIDPLLISWKQPRVYTEAGGDGGSIPRPGWDRARIPQMARKAVQAPRYEGTRIHKLVGIGGLLPHRVVERYNPGVGQKREVACFYEVLVDGEWVELCRYDSCHDDFHRHRAHWPKATTRPRGRKIDKWFKGVPVKKRIAMALDDVKENVRAWQRLIEREEVRENETDDEASAAS
jgi:hypothetical protein